MIEIVRGKENKEKIKGSRNRNLTPLHREGEKKGIRKTPSLKFFILEQGTLDEQARRHYLG